MRYAQFFLRTEVTSPLFQVDHRSHWMAASLFRPAKNGARANVLSREIVWDAQSGVNSDRAPSASHMAKAAWLTMVNMARHDAAGCWFVENLRNELDFLRARRNRGQLHEFRREVLQAILPTPVQAERDLNILRLMIGGNRASLTAEALDDIYVLR